MSRAVLFVGPVGYVGLRYGTTTAALLTPIRPIRRAHRQKLAALYTTVAGSMFVSLSSAALAAMRPEGYPFDRSTSSAAEQRSAVWPLLMRRKQCH